MKDIIPGTETFFLDGDGETQTHEGVFKFIRFFLSLAKFSINTNRSYLGS